MNSENETHHEPDANSSAAAAAALLFSSRGIQPDTLDSGTPIHTQVEGGQRGTRL